VTLPPTPLPLQNSFQSPPACIGAEALPRRPPGGCEFLVSPRAITGARKNFSCDDPRDAYDMGLLYLSFLLPPSVFLALSTANPLSIVALAVLPSAPLSCPVAALLAAVTRQGMSRSENPAAPLQQTNAVARPARSPFSPLSTQASFFGLILEAS